MFRDVCMYHWSNGFQMTYLDLPENVTPEQPDAVSLWSIWYHKNILLAVCWYPCWISVLIYYYYYYYSHPDTWDYNVTIIIYKSNKLRMGSTKQIILRQCLNILWFSRNCCVQSPSGCLIFSQITERYDY